MIALATTSWGFRRSLRQPFLWLWAAGLLLFWPTFVAFAPLGITLEAADTGPAAREVALLALLAAGVLTLDQLSRLGWFLDKSAQWSRTALELGVFLGTALALLSAACLLTLLTGSLRGIGLLGLGLALLHVAGVVSVLARLRVAASLRPVLLLGLLWLAPALLAERGWLGDWTVAGLDVSCRLRVGTGPDLDGTAWKALLGPIIGWFALASLLAGGVRPSHALRSTG